MLKKDSKIYVAGHRGLVGSAITRALKARGFSNLILKARDELDLINQKGVQDFFKKEKPEFVFLAAAKVGGIMANKTQPAKFIYENLALQTNVIESAYQNKVKKLLFLGSSCIYPKLSPQPIKEEYLLSGPLEETNKAYAVAKIAGAITCQSYREEYGVNFIAAMPTNLYGPNDNFDLESSHVLPALIRKFDEAKTTNRKAVELWGNGTALREFLHVDDLAEACIFLMENYNEKDIVNIGTGEEISIKDLANLIKKIIGYKGETVWDKTKPNGMPRKLLNVDKIHQLGWHHKTPLEDGIKSTYDWYKKSGVAGKKKIGK
jgi:GDP-L-fucose synthase